MKHTLRSLAAVAFAAALAACNAKGNAAPVEDHAGAHPAEAAAAVPAVPATGTVIEVRMVTDDKGNYFEPADITAKPGDVLRFTLVSGVHNVSFPADQNANAAGLPEPSPMLQLAGQTQDVPVNLAAGQYKFQCDPHAALGMVGTLTVQ